MKYGIENDNKFLIIDDDKQRLENTVTKFMPQFNVEDITEYKDDEVEFGYDGNYYLKGHAPEKPPLSREEISELRKQYRRDNIDDLTDRRSRKKALNDWTDEDEAAYVAAAKAVEEYIAENFPYPEEATSDDIQNADVSADKEPETGSETNSDDIKEEKPE